MLAPPALSTLADAGIVAVIRAPSASSAIRAVDALVRGGVTGIEITYSTPDAADVIGELSRRYDQRIYLGAGTVTTAAQAEQAVAAGARFLVSPGTTPTLAAAMFGTGAAVLLGALTPTEVMQAVELGATAVKIFPASLGGPAFLKALRGPFPDVALMPTGGVNPANLGQWLDAGAVAVGAGGELCSAAALQGEDWTTIEAAARNFIAALNEYRNATNTAS